MGAIGSSSLTVGSYKPSWAEPDGSPSVVWLRGEHDISTMTALSDTLSRAIALDEPEVVIDLGEVEFMSSDTAGVLVRAATILRGRSQSLTLRAPSPAVLRVLAIWGLSDLVRPEAFADAIVRARDVRDRYPR